MSRKEKRVVEEFDVLEFLRPTNTDLKSALHSLLGTEDQSIAAIKLGPGLNLDEPVKLTPGIKLEPAPVLKATVKLEPDLSLIPPVILRPAPKLAPPVKLIAPVSSIAGTNLGDATRKRNFAIREASQAADGHSRAEEQVYRALWAQAASQADGSRLIQIGYLALARIADLSESNARINLRSLIRKLAVEEFATYVCEQGQGRTWRIFSAEQILEKRRRAGLCWYMKRTLAVVFVDPQTGDRLLS